MKSSLFKVIFSIFAIFLIMIVVTFLVTSLILRDESLILTSREKIAVVDINGTISDADKIVEQIRKYGKDDSVKGIILRIDSPGGGVAPSQEIFNEILKVRKSGKRVIASMGTVAASGGYYIASASDKIIANPGTITGSIGVVMQFSNLEALMKKVGLKVEIIKSGKYKDAGSPLRSLTEEEKEVLKRVIDDVYEQFVHAVSKGRGLSVEKVRRLADGRIFSGNQAKELGLVDDLGGLRDAIEITSEMVGIKGEPKIVRESPQQGFLSRWIGEKLFNHHIFHDSSHRYSFSLQYIWQY